MARCVPFERPGNINRTRIATKNKRGPAAHASIIMKLTNSKQNLFFFQLNSQSKRRKRIIIYEINSIFYLNCNAKKRKRGKMKRLIFC